MHWKLNEFSPAKSSFVISFFLRVGKFDRQTKETWLFVIHTSFSVPENIELDGAKKLTFENMHGTITQVS